MNSIREEAILRHLNAVHQLDVHEAATLLDASPVTLRRDFNALADRGIVERVRGGIRSLPSGSMNSFSARESKYAAEKAEIARKAARLLTPGDVVIIDGGTTTFHLHALLPSIPLQIITNSLPLASALENRRGAQTNPEIILTGGVLYPESGLLVGPGVQRSLKEYHADWTFLSVGGIDLGGVTNSNELVSDVERAMIECAKQVAVLADSSKIGARALSRVCGLDPIDLIVTSSKARNTKATKEIESSGVRVI